MKMYLPLILSFTLVVGVVACKSDCTEKVHVSERGGVTGTYTDSDGRDHQITTDENGT